jgi:hypothetical protein
MSSSAGVLNFSRIFLSFILPFNILLSYFRRGQKQAPESLRGLLALSLACSLHWSGCIWIGLARGRSIARKSALRSASETMVLSDRRSCNKTKLKRELGIVSESQALMTGCDLLLSKSPRLGTSLHNISPLYLHSHCRS